MLLVVVLILSTDARINETTNQRIRRLRARARTPYPIRYTPAESGLTFRLMLGMLQSGKQESMKTRNHPALPMATPRRGKSEPQDPRPTALIPRPSGLDLGPWTSDARGSDGPATA